MIAAQLLAACVCVVGFAPPQKHVRGPTQQYSTIQYPKNPLESVLSLGAPRFQPPNGTYVTAGGVGVTRASYTVEDAHGATEALVDALDDRRGVLMHSSYEFPGRYARWTVGFSDPPVLLSGRARDFALSALNDRGRKILQMLEGHLRDDDAVASLLEEDDYARLVGKIRQSDPSQIRREEERSKEPSLMSVVRNVVQTLYHPDDPQLGLYGALGYDLMFQFEPINPSLSRKEQQRDVALFIPDEILVVDTREQQAWTIQYDFTWCVAGEEETVSTVDMARSGSTRSHEEGTPLLDRDVEPGGYASLTERSKQEFACGNLFEVVLSQQWSVPATARPSAVFRTLRKRNPSPYGFLMNLRGEDDSSVPWISGYDKGEYLVGASPEMFVRVERIEGKMRVETCPISGTIERGADALEDAVQVRTLLGSKKDESELTMCTDVDRNDKSRICAPGSVKVIGRRQIEMYSKLIHTVDHVEGYLREGFDALDAFLCHTWAVTVTGAPKVRVPCLPDGVAPVRHRRACQTAWRWPRGVSRSSRDDAIDAWRSGGLERRRRRDAGIVSAPERRRHRVLTVPTTQAWAARFIEKHERSARAWYGGAVGHVAFDGSLNTGLTLRTIHYADGVASVRAGATLLYDSDPVAEESETELKASAMLGALRSTAAGEAPTPVEVSVEGFDPESAGVGKRVLLVDHEDSFVHTLANYLRQTGADVEVSRCGPAALNAITEDGPWALVVLSPGPGCPSDFDVSGTLDACSASRTPVFGVCLGLQGIVEHFGGTLGQLNVPVHGKPAQVSAASRSTVFEGLPDEFDVARYHSLHGVDVPDELEVVATTESGGEGSVVMGVEHKSLPIAAVQFHPESILTNPRHGLRMLANCLRRLSYD